MGLNCLIIVDLVVEFVVEGWMVECDFDLIGWVGCFLFVVVVFVWMVVIVVNFEVDVVEVVVIDLG